MRVQQRVTTSHNRSQRVKIVLQQVITSQKRVTTSQKTSATCQNNNNKSKLQTYKCRMIFLKSGRCIIKILMGEGVVKWSGGVGGSLRDLFKTC